jgi:hypothetical protein
MLLSVERPFVGASAFPIPGAMLLHCIGLVPAVLPASTDHGERTLGSPRNLGDPVVSSAQSRPEQPGDQLQASAAHSSVEERKERVNAEVPPSEGNEVRRDGRQEVVAL